MDRKLVPDEKHFHIINAKYNSFQRFLLKNGMFPHKETSLGFWGVTPTREVFEFFSQIRLQEHSKFLDLGSGDGRVVLIASLFGVEAHGLEIDPWLINVSLHIRRELDLPYFARTKFLEKNFLEHPLHEYDVLYTSPDKPFYREDFETKLLNEINPNGNLIVHGWEFHPRFLKKIEEHIINGEKFSIYSLN
ncbi:MAG: hypothetical protein QXK37_06580 [Candidatus Woesearchaeota archaeon]